MIRIEVRNKEEERKSLLQTISKPSEILMKWQEVLGLKEIMTVK